MSEAPPPPRGLPKGAKFCGFVRCHRNELHPNGAVVSETFSSRLANAAKAIDQPLIVYRVGIGAAPVKFDNIRLSSSGGKWRISGAASLLNSMNLLPDAKHVALWRMPSRDERLFLSSATIPDASIKPKKNQKRPLLTQSSQPQSKRPVTITVPASSSSSSGQDEEKSDSYSKDTAKVGLLRGAPASPAALPQAASPASSPAGETRAQVSGGLLRCGVHGDISSPRSDNSKLQGSESPVRLGQRDSCAAAITPGAAAATAAAITSAAAVATAAVTTPAAAVAAQPRGSYRGEEKAAEEITDEDDWELQCVARVAVTPYMRAGGYLVLPPTFAVCAGLSLNGPASAASCVVQLVQPDGREVSALLALSLVPETGHPEEAAATAGGGGDGVGVVRGSEGDGDTGDRGPVRLDGAVDSADGASMGARQGCTPGRRRFALTSGVVLRGLAGWMAERCVGVGDHVLVARTADGQHYIALRAEVEELEGRVNKKHGGGEEGLGGRVGSDGCGGGASPCTPHRPVEGEESRAVAAASPKEPSADGLNPQVPRSTSPSFLRLPQPTLEPPRSSPALRARWGRMWAPGEVRCSAAREQTTAGGGGGGGSQHVGAAGPGGDKGGGGGGGAVCPSREGGGGAVADRRLEERELRRHNMEAVSQLLSDSLVGGTVSATHLLLAQLLASGSPPQTPSAAIFS